MIGALRLGGGGTVLVQAMSQCEPLPSFTEQFPRTRETPACPLLMRRWIDITLPDGVHV